MGMSYRYDSWNRVQEISYHDGETVIYGYDRGGNLLSMGSKVSSYIGEIVYNASGQKIRTLYGNGTSAHYAYDNLQRNEQVEVRILEYLKIFILHLYQCMERDIMQGWDIRMIVIMEVYMGNKRLRMQ